MEHNIWTEQLILLVLSFRSTHERRKTDYTLVLKGFIQLSMAQFPHGTCGTQLDALARLPMWKAGINYLHGTGHGVGCFLNVHEGPHQFRMNHMPALLVPGMTVTNEPGIYKPDAMEYVRKYHVNCSVTRDRIRHLL